MSSQSRPKKPIHSQTEKNGKSTEHQQHQRHDDAICDFILTEKGCTKGADCLFKHPTAPDGTQTNRVCEYFGGPRGCTKAENCKFLHPIRYSPKGEPATRVCDFWLTAQGCIKGNTCDYLHPRAAPAKYNMGKSGRGIDSVSGNKKSSSGVVPAGAKTKPCKYYDTEEGCNRGDACTYKHGEDDTVAPTPSKSIGSDRRNGDPPRRAGVGPRRGASIVPSIHKVPKPCQYYESKDGCRKGDLCSFVHMVNRPCNYFKAGTCKKGAACDHLHTKGDEAKQQE